MFRPQASAGGEDVYPGIHEKAAALLHSLICNHPFVDGNKRTALLAVVVFYGMNGWEVVPERGDAFELCVQTATGELTLAAIVGRLEHMAVPAVLPE